MNIGAIVPARMTSSRLPGKHMMKLNGVPSLQRVINRLHSVSLIDYVVIATTTNKDDDIINDFCSERSYKCFRGDEENLLDRTLRAAYENNVDVIVDVTADCPLIDPYITNEIIELHLKNNYDKTIDMLRCNYHMTTNIADRTFPRGMDVRVVNTKTLEKVQSEIDNDIDISHGGYTWMYLNPKSKKNYNVMNHFATKEQNRPELEITLDTLDDYEFINWLYEAGKEYILELTCEQIISLIDIYPFKYENIKKNVKRKDYFKTLSNWYEMENKKDVESINHRSRKHRTEK